MWNYMRAGKEQFLKQDHQGVVSLPIPRIQRIFQVLTKENRPQKTNVTETKLVFKGDTTSLSQQQQTKNKPW